MCSQAPSWALLSPSLSYAPPLARSFCLYTFAWHWQLILSFIINFIAYLVRCIFSNPYFHHISLFCFIVDLLGFIFADFTFSRYTLCCACLRIVHSTRCRPPCMNSNWIIGRRRTQLHDSNNLLAWWMSPWSKSNVLLAKIRVISSFFFPPFNPSNHNQLMKPVADAGG